MSIQPSSSGNLAKRLGKLAQLYEKGQASDLMTRTLDKLFGYEAKTSRGQLKQFSKDLAKFESRYGMSSEEFYRKYQAGETDDRMDFVEWASLVQMVANLQRRLQVLTGEGRG